MARIEGTKLQISNPFQDICDKKLHLGGGMPRRNLKKIYEGFVLNDKAARSTAQRILRKFGHGSTLLLSFWNGSELWIKEIIPNKVRVSTDEEWERYWIKETEKMENRVAG